MPLTNIYGRQPLLVLFGYLGPIGTLAAGCVLLNINNHF